ncbi:MAG: CoA transferase, partial [Gammaproteobacteria bacterium]|nr:CoA transferase [Gammaproteobacteria bacterium]
VGLAHPNITPYGGFQTSDGATLVISIQNEREWVALAGEVMERPDVASDPRFAGNSARTERRAEVDGMVQSCFSRFPRKEMEARLRAARIAYGTVNDVAGLSEHAALRRWTVDSDTGPVQMPAHPDAGREQPRSRLPRLGEHDRAIRAEFS